jgi:predicted glycosyltransferase
MSTSGKKIWIDIEEPKTGIMFKSLFKLFQEEDIDLLITARDYDSTFQIMDDIGIDYIKVGKHGGEKLEDKLQTYIDRLNELLPHVKKFEPDYFITFSSVEGARLSYGLKIPSFGYNDEPRNEPVCKLILPLLDKVLTPECVPLKWYLKLGAVPEKLIRYNGIDEIAWLSEYNPNPDILEKSNLERGKYVIIRSEPSFASYFIDSLKPEETMISQFFPSIYKEFPNHKYFLLVRTEKQEQFLKKNLKEVSNSNVEITRYLSNLVDLCYYSSLVISGGGTIVRESSLLDVPSIEFFPGDSAPQENFLRDHKFPLEHIKEPVQIASRAIEILSQSPTSSRFTLAFKENLNRYENPNKVCFDYVIKDLSKDV